MTFNCEGTLLDPVIVHNADFPEDGKNFYKKDRTFKQSSNGLMSKSVLRSVLVDLEKYGIFLYFQS